MLAIRMQRTGRSGHAQFRVIVQDSRFSPTRGRVVSYLGSYDPHTKAAQIDSLKAAQYLENGAQPSDTVARLFKKEGIKLPAWVKLSQPQKREVRNPEKRRSTAPAKPEAPAPEPAAAAPAGQPAEPSEPETTSVAPAEEAQPAQEPPAEEASLPEPAAEPPPAADESAETPAESKETPPESDSDS